MAVKTDLLGFLITCALAAYVYAALGLALRRRVFGQVAFAMGFGLCAAAFAVRWVQAAHVPLQSMFEVFLTLGMLVHPLSLLAGRLGASGQGAHAAIGAAVLFPAAFVFSAAPTELPPVLRSALFVPHVSAYMLAYVILAMAAAQAVWQVVAPSGSEQAIARERATWRLVQAGVPLLTAGLVLGAIWGKLAWGDYWHWDPKELWSLATWLIFLGAFALRGALGGRRPRVCMAVIIAGAAAIGMTLLWVNLTAGSPLHAYAS